MSSNYVWDDEPDEVHVTPFYWDDEDEEPEEREAPCPAHCRNGQVEVHGQETDCITCEGYGTILIPT